MRVVKTHGKQAIYTIWSIQPHALLCQQTTKDMLHKNLPTNVKGIENRDSVSCYAISAIQCIIHCSYIQDAILIESDNAAGIRSCIENYMSRDRDTSVDILKVRDFIGGTFIEMIQQDAGQFINSLCEPLGSIRITVIHQISESTNLPFLRY